MAKTEKIEKVYSVDFSQFVQLGADGNPNRDEAIARFTSQLDSYIETESHINSIIVAAINQVFDSHPVGTVLSMDSVRFLALQQMQFDSDSIGALQAKITMIVHSCSQFKIARGKNGGVCRIIDTPTE